MNDAVQPGLPRAEANQAALSAQTPGVYANLRDLAALEYRTRGFSFLPRQPVHSLLSGRRASRLRGRGLNFDEIRGYQPGDDVRNIDWRVTARLQSPHVRIYTEERDRPCILLIDQRLTMFFGSRRAMKSVTAAELAALAAWRVFHAQDRIGAIVFDDHDCVELPPLRSRQRVMQILQAVLTKNQALRADDTRPPNPGMLNTVLEKARRLATHDCLIVLISDGYGADAQSVHWVTELAVHNDFMTLLVFDPLEAELPGAGRLTISDGRQQLEINSSDRTLQRGFKQDFDARLERMRTIARQRQAPLLPISAAEEVIPQVQRHLGFQPHGLQE